MFEGFPGHRCRRSNQLCVNSTPLQPAFLQGVTYEELSQATQGVQLDVSFELSGEGLACLQTLPDFSGFDPRREAACRNAPRCFSMKFRQVTEAFGLKSSSIDACTKPGELMMTVIKDVDDLKMLGPSPLIEKLVKHLTATFGKMEVEWHEFTFLRSAAPPA